MKVSQPPGVGAPSQAWQAQNGGEVLCVALGTHMQPRCAGKL